MNWVVIKRPDSGDVSKSAKFFDTLEEAIVYKESAPYPNMVVAEVLDESSWIIKLLMWFARPSKNNGQEVCAV